MVAMVDRKVSTLNPNAPVYDPVGFREVEDFSPKWFELVKTSKWFRDFWLSFNSEYDFDAGDEFSDMEKEFEEMIMSSEESEIDGSTVTEADVAKYLKMLLSIADPEKLYRSKVLASSCSQKFNQKKKSFSCRRNHQIYQPR